MIHEGFRAGGFNPSHMAVEHKSLEHAQIGLWDIMSDKIPGIIQELKIVLGQAGRLRVQEMAWDDANCGL